MTADDKCSCHYREKFLQAIQTQLSKNPKPFSQFFLLVLKFTRNFETWKVKDKPQSLKNFEIIDSEIRVFLKVWKVLFRTIFHSQRACGCKKLLKSARHHFYAIASSSWDRYKWKTSLLITSKILGLFAYTLTADDMYSLHNRENFWQPIQLQLSKNANGFFANCNWTSEIYIKFWRFCKEKKTQASELKYLQNHWLQKKCLLKCLKGPVLEHPSTVNAFTSLRHCWNLHGSTFFYCIMILRQVELGKFSLCQIWNLRTVC